ncbi:MAG: hypothetical protein VW715_11120 [Rhodospirillales bacterium]
MKVLLTLEGGFAKTLFEVATDSGKDKHTVAMFLMGFRYARNNNLQSPEVIGLINHMGKNDAIDTITQAFNQGVLAGMEHKLGKLEVIE